MKQILFIVLSLMFTSSYSQSVREIADSMHIHVSGAEIITGDSLLSVVDANALIQVGVDEASNIRCLETYQNIKEQATARYGMPEVIVSNNSHEKVRFDCGVKYLYLQLSYGSGQFTMVMYTK